MKIPESDYMKIERKQALFECEVRLQFMQMIKGAREIMSFKDYQELEFIRESEDSEAVTNDEK